MTVQVMARAVQVPAQIKLRPSVTQMSDDDLARYRNAVTGFMARTDNRGYQYFANWHGVAFGLCQHHNDLFLPWHRGYLYHFELALQDVDPQVSLPWWNWMDEPGLPAAFTDADASSNPLQAAPVQPIGVQPQPDWPTETVRDPGVPQDPAPVPPPLAAVSHPRESEIVELKFFGGLNAKEIGEVLNVSTKTVLRDWQFAKAWLNRHLASEELYG